MKTPVVVLRKMTIGEKRIYRDHAVEGYLTDMVRAGALDAAQARVKANRDYDSVAANEDNDWRHVESDGYVVGSLIWRLMVEDGLRVLHLSDIEIFETFRGRGLGRAAMEALMAEAKVAGAVAVDLNVWANNDVARFLYESLGFRATSTHMRLGLDP